MFENYTIIIPEGVQKAVDYTGAVLFCIFIAYLITKRIIRRLSERDE